MWLTVRRFRELGEVAADRTPEKDALAVLKRARRLIELGCARSIWCGIVLTFNAFRLECFVGDSAQLLRPVTGQATKILAHDLR